MAMDRLGIKIDNEWLRAATGKGLQRTDASMESIGSFGLGGAIFGVENPGPIAEGDVYALLA
jgi:hypothetical protein